jgi:hypothetical protein
MPVPERLAAIQRPRDQVADEILERALVTGRRNRDAVDVKIKVATKRDRGISLTRSHRRAVRRSRQLFGSRRAAVSLGRCAVNHASPD